MKKNAKENLKEIQVRLNEAANTVKGKVKISKFKKGLIKLYLKSPPKFQYALAKYGVKHVIKKTKEDIEEVIRH